MLIIRLINFIKGYVAFKLEGLNLERAINEILKLDIPLWDIDRINYTTLEAKSTYNSYKKIQEVISGKGYKIFLQREKGLPILFIKLKHRKSILAGFILSVLLVLALSSFIWIIDVNCDNYLLEKDILINLKKSNFKVGTFKYKIDIPALENDLLVKYDNIAFINIDIKGIKATVDVVEKKLVSKEISSSRPCDIVAKKDGIIEKVIAREGDAVVKKGDVVKRGQLLITGTIIRNGELLRHVHSSGDVYARTMYEKSDKLPVIQKVKEKTGQTHNRFIIKIGSTSLILGGENVPFNKYVVETEKKSVFKWRSIEVPVEIIRERYFEVIEKSITNSDEDIKKSLYDKLTVELFNELPRDAKVLNKNIVYNKEGNYIHGTLTIETLESIGEKREINNINILD